VTLLQRKTSSVGKGLGKTTGWTHRITLQRRGVKMVSGVEYKKIDEAGLHLVVNGQPDDTVIICAGQLPLRTLHDDLSEDNISSHLIGGAFEAGELDAKRAIKQATELALEL